MPIDDTRPRAPAPPHRTARTALLAVLALIVTLLTMVLPQQSAADQQTTGGWTTNGVAAPTVVAGRSIAISAQVTSTSTRRALVDVEVYSSSGQKVFQRYWDAPRFENGVQRTFTATWRVPASATAAQYIVKIGIFTSGWATEMHWNDNADRIAVTRPSSTTTTTVAATTTTVPATTTTVAATTTTAPVATTTTVGATTTTVGATTTTVGATTTTVGATTTTVPATTTTQPATTTTMSMPGQIPADQLPRGNPAYADSRILFYDGPPSNVIGNDTANFRQSCEFSHMSYDDPIVYPGQPGRAHLHSFFGNIGVNAHSTRATLTAAGQKGSCAGGAANLSAYWTPAMMNGATPIAPSEVGIYYKSLGIPASTLQDVPQGLKMVAGNQHALTGQQPYIIHWECIGQPYASHTTIPQNCPAGSLLAMHVDFPQCWDGVNLDSPDHISHLRYADWNQDCAIHPGHRVPLPQLSIITRWRVPAGGAGNLRLSSDMPGATPGASGHADYMEGWHRPTLQTWSQVCMREGRDTSNTLCEGTHFVFPHQFASYR